MSDIKIGEKVVCVDDREWTHQAGEELIYRKTYTVLDITVCKKCGRVYYNVGCKLKDKKDFSSCCTTLVGAGIDWVEAKKFIPLITTFKDYCRKEVVEQMQKDVELLIKNKEYEKAIEVIKRMEKIHEEL